MRRILATSALMFAWLCANGALLDGMQVFAWARMLTRYSQTMSFTAAVQETFDPAKPCELCRSVAQAKETTQQQSPLSNEHGASKFVLTLDAAEEPVLANDHGEWRIGPDGPLATHCEPVPVPPPRV